MSTVLSPAPAAALVSLRPSLRLRLTLFLLCFGGLLLLVSITTFRVTRAVAALDKRAMITRVEVNSTVYEMKTGLLRLALLLARLEWTGDVEARDAFLKESASLVQWMDTRRAHASADGRAALERLVPNLDEALAEIRNVLRITNLADLLSSGQTSLVRLGDDLPGFVADDARITRAQTETAMANFREVVADLNWLRGWSLISTLLIAVLALWLAAWVWRELIAPLRSRVIENQALILRQEKLSALGTLAAGIAHEIRNPLNSIKARLYTQSRLLTPASAVSEDNRVIQDEVVRLEQIVRDFLVFARPSAPRLEPVKVSTTLDAASALLAPELELAGMTLRRELGEDPLIRADATQLRHVLVNLMRNAAESMPRGGVIILRSRTGPAPRGEVARRLAIIEVADNGPGMTADVQRRLFDPFFTTKEGGTGLGLSTSAGIVEAHGGRIECLTEANVGTTFRILLPLANDHADEPRPDPDH